MNGTKTAHGHGQPTLRARMLAGRISVNGESAAVSPAAVPAINPRTIMAKIRIPATLPTSANPSLKSSAAKLFFSRSLTMLHTVVPQ